MNYTQLQQYELSNLDIKKILGNNINIIPYPKLNNYDNLLSCMRNNNMFILFFETVNNTTGHWQCMFLLNSEYCFFDSYGLKPSGDKNYISSKILIELNEIKPYLPSLINKCLASNEIVTYNKNDYQSWTNDVSTCGRHVCSRLLNKHLNEKQYYNYLMNYRTQYNLNSFDEAVIHITYQIIHK